MTQPVPTTQDLLDEVKRCIRAVLVGGQEYSNALGRTVKRADLAGLRRLQSDLESELRAEASGDTGIRIADFSEI